MFFDSISKRYRENFECIVNVYKIRLYATPKKKTESKGINALLTKPINLKAINTSDQRLKLGGKPIFMETRVNSKVIGNGQVPALLRSKREWEFK